MLACCRQAREELRGLKQAEEALREATDGGSPGRHMYGAGADQDIYV